MKFGKKHHRKIKRYRKINTYEYVIVFDNSNNLIEYICNNNHNSIISSSLYTIKGQYQLLIKSNYLPHMPCIKQAVFKDKLHLDEIKFKSQLICKDNIISKIQKAFKET